MVSVTVTFAGTDHRHPQRTRRRRLEPQDQRLRRVATDAIDRTSATRPRMVTSKGTMIIALDANAAPKTVNNFVFLAR